MKPKYGFSSYAKNKIPLNHSKQTLTNPSPTSSTTLGKLLPNGFKVGEHVYYTSYGSTRIHGIVVDHEQAFAPQSENVWATWRGSHQPGYMPLSTVHYANE